MKDMAYGPPEIMTVAMARLLRDGELVYNGVASILPMLAIEVARRTHAPRLLYLNIGGGMDARPATLPASSCGPELLAGTPAIIDQAEFYQLVMRGRVDAMFMGGVQVDGAGRINSSVIGDASRPRVRLPGGGGAAVILPTAGRVILWRTRHDPRTFVGKLDFVTAAGNVDRVVSPLCVFRRQDGRLSVESIHPGVTAESIIEQTGFPLTIPAECPQTPAPTEAELRAIADFDPHRLRNLEFR